MDRYDHELAGSDDGHNIMSGSLLVIEIPKRDYSEESWINFDITTYKRQ